MLKIRSIPTEDKQTAQMKEWTTETRSIESNIPAIPYGTRDCATENSQRYASSNTVQPPLPSLDLPDSDNLSENREESQIAEPLCTDDTTWKMHPMHKMHNAHHTHQGQTSQHMRTLEIQPSHLVIFICKDTIAPGLVDYQLENVELELYTYFVVFQSGLVQNMPNLKYLV